MQYRPEIDGLRALAVLPVILFHAGFSAFSGGFIGVDVFFVISGYLITTIIIQEQQDGRFSLLGFYERRMRRILPALFFVMAVCLPFAWFWLLPSAFEEFLLSIIASVFFVSNIFFWRKTGYFEGAAEEKPLLHTWSLAVEEQYYIFFPLFIMLFWRLGRQPVFWMIVGMALASLILSEIASRNYPVANFFLAPTRVWEIFAGAICAFVHLYHTQKPRQLFSALGLAMIVCAVFVFDHTTPFPSLYTLLPVLGCCLVILFGDTNTWAGRMLAMRPMVGIGLMSYSAYLWHQPLFAFARLTNHDVPSALFMSVLSVSALVLAFFSWRFVEQPFRHKTGDVFSISRKWMFLFSGAGAVLLVGFAATMLVTKTQTNYFNAKIEHATNPEVKRVYDLVNMHTGYDVRAAMGDNGACHFWTEDIANLPQARFDSCSKRFGKALIIFGDSHAMNIYNALFFNPFHPFMVFMSVRDDLDNASTQNRLHVDFAAFVKTHKQHVKALIYNRAGSYLMTDFQGNTHSQELFNPKRPFTFYDAYIDEISRYLNGLSQDARVLWLGPFVEARRSYKDIFRLAEVGMTIKPRAIDVFDQLDQHLLSKSAENHYEYVSARNILGIKSHELVIGDCLTYRDEDHFSLCGERIFGARLSPVLKTYLERN